MLEQELPKSGLVLEVASGTGEHAVFFASRFASLDWQPTDFDPDALASTDAWADEAEMTNLRPAISLDASKPEWPLDRADAILCVNMVHISPWVATNGLLSGASRILPSAAPLVLYGPYIENDVATSRSNERFNTDLRQRDARWGLRQIEELDRLAAKYGLARTARYQMPANNLTLVYRTD